jgi:hypothetical protein
MSPSLAIGEGDGMVGGNRAKRKLEKKDKKQLRKEAEERRKQAGREFGNVAAGHLVKDLHHQTRGRARVPGPGGGAGGPVDDEGTPTMDQIKGFEKRRRPYLEATLCLILPQCSFSLFISLWTFPVSGEMSSSS